MILLRKSTLFHIIDFTIIVRFFPYSSISYVRHNFPVFFEEFAYVYFSGKAFVV